MSHSELMFSHATARLPVLRPFDKHYLHTPQTCTRSQEFSHLNSPPEGMGAFSRTIDLRTPLFLLPPLRFLLFFFCGFSCFLWQCLSSSLFLVLIFHFPFLWLFVFFVAIPPASLFMLAPLIFLSRPTLPHLPNPPARRSRSPVQFWRPLSLHRIALELLHVARKSHCYRATDD